jgi:hypothetical protein
LLALPGQESTDEEKKQPLAVPELPTVTGEGLDAKTFVGTWTATKADGATFKMTLNDDGTFEWTSDNKGQTQTVKGVFEVEGKTLAMEPDNGGVLVGNVNAPENGEFKFAMIGGLPEDPGLDFKKVQ